MGRVHLGSARVTCRRPGWFFHSPHSWGGPAALVALMMLASCERSIDEATLTRETEEAQQAEASARERFSTGDERDAWTLTVTGRVPSTTVLPFREVERLEWHIPDVFDERTVQTLVGRFIDVDLCRLERDEDLFTFVPVTGR